MKLFYTIIILILLPFFAAAQALPFTAADYNPATMAMGGSYSVETGSTAFSAFGNISAAAYSSNKMDVAAGYTLWEPSALKTNVINVAGTGKIGKNMAVAAGFSYGLNPEYEILDSYGMSAGTFKPSQMRISAGFAWKFLPFLSLGANIGCASSKLAAESSYGAFVADIYLMSIIKDFKIAIGTSSLGTPVTSASGQKYSLPSSVEIGAGFEHVYGRRHGVDARVQADCYFSGAIAASVGAAYNFDNLFSIRAGYRYGGKSVIPSYASVGAGIQFFGVHLDIAYLIAQKNNPTANTLSLSLGYRF
ncbi:MAG: PorV/PorQ family protein [Candidatus Cryptobacteroides sp.]